MELSKINLSQYGEQVRVGADAPVSIKMESKGAMRQLAKLMLNNLYGKFLYSDTDSIHCNCTPDEVKGALYSDTDSIHCNCTTDEVKGAPEDPVKFNH